MKIQKLINDLYEQFHNLKSNLATLYRFLCFIIPFLTIAYYFIFIFDYLPSDMATKYSALTLSYFFPPLGKESVIPAMLTDKLGPPLPAWIVGSTIVIMDVISSAIVAYNWWFAEFILNHIPFLNRGYEWLQVKAEKYRKKPWLTMSLLLFMIIPFQGTGGVNTTILARLLGVSAKKTVAICFVGSTITTTLWILWWLGFFNFFLFIYSIFPVSLGTVWYILYP